MKLKKSPMVVSGNQVAIRGGKIVLASLAQAIGIYQEKHEFMMTDMNGKNVKIRHPEGILLIGNYKVKIRLT